MISTNTNQIDVLGVLQARLSSSRLPGKVLMDLQGKPMIIQQLERIKESKHLGKVVVATSSESSDDRLAEVVTSFGYEIWRGPLDDVFARFTEVANHWPSNHLVRMTADCPLISPEVIDLVIDSHKKSHSDYTSNTLVRTYPRGLDVECFSNSAFSRLADETLTPEELEHVTLGFHNRKDVYYRTSVEAAIDHSADRWTVDYPEDLEYVRWIYRNLYPQNSHFDEEEIYSFLESHPSERRIDFTY